MYQYAPSTNGLAIASLVCSCFGFFYGIPAILGIVFGFVARSQVKKSNGTQTGLGLAVAGIAIGAAWILIGAALVIFFIVALHNITTPGRSG
jgi:hypothetical protein